MSRMRTFLTCTSVVTCVGMGFGMWSLMSPGEERKKELLKNFPESNPVRMEESKKKTAMLLQVLKEAAETNENLARGPGK